MYKEDVILRTNLAGGFASMDVPFGQKLDLTIPVTTRDAIRFEAFEKASENRVLINEGDSYWIIPQGNREKVFVLNLPLFGMCC